EIFGCPQLQLDIADDPPLFAQLFAAGEGGCQTEVPVSDEMWPGGLVPRAGDPAGVGRQARDPIAFQLQPVQARRSASRGRPRPAGRASAASVRARASK